MPSDQFDRMIRELSEPKLELLDGRLTVGNGAGNFQLLRHILEGWGAEAALPMAPAERWWQALAQGFQPFTPPAPEKPAGVWRAWAAQLSYSPELAPAGPMLDGKHRAAREALMIGLFGLAHEHHFAHVAGRDVVMRLGDDAFTPDVLVTGPRTAPRLNEHYLDGPADLVIEILLRGHEAYDRQVKLGRYGAGGVPEYWLVDPDRQVVECLRWTGRKYEPAPPDPEGNHRPAAFPGLVLQPDKLWHHEHGWGRGPNPFRIEAAMPAAAGGFAKGGVAWGDLEFDPRPGLEPRRLSFEEFASWAPQAKFELVQGKPWVGGSRGSQHVLGLLLRTEGLARAVSVLHPREWIAALLQAEENRAADPARREHWWRVARQAAALLRERFSFGRLVVIGDLVRPQPLNVWSMITIVAVDPAPGRDRWEADQLLFETFRDEPDINLVRHEHATRAERQAVAAEGVDL